MSLLSKLPCRDNIVFVIEYDMHSHMGNRKMPAGGFFEICKGKLCDGIEDEPQLPILFYTEGLRIVTSNVVSTTTLPFTRRFHNFISKILSE